MEAANDDIPCDGADVNLKGAMDGKKVELDDVDVDVGIDVHESKIYQLICSFGVETSN